MIRIEFNVAPVLAKLAEARAALGDLTPLHREIAGYMIKATRERFQAGTAPDGTRWRQKSPTTLAEYVRRGHGNRPRPLIGPSERLGKEITGTGSADGAEIGSALIYSAVMQFGAAKGALGKRAPWGNIPARPWLGVSEEDATRIVQLADIYLEAALDEK